eukprot:CAMPEP_0194080316 /NCGR_PEP_ID=MMETSP0149-20130528/6359_1 /TAXON_ID=122233 /ORGANISM="Chaetoceros debilis, Strain MM31A-1" /LENGTH=106 /DNA_ID=CAMNT_0038761997 /DNA_START=61 /DNA_END=381 /DNA_ORIENTATION=+
MKNKTKMLIFHLEKKIDRTYLSKELDGTANLGDWLQATLPLGVSQMMTVLSSLQLQFKSVNDDTKVEHAERDGDSLIAVKSAKTEKKQGIELLTAFAASQSLYNRA